MASPTLLEPVMKVVVTTPAEFQGGVSGDLNRRRGLIVGADERADGATVIEARVPLAELFGYTTDLRSMSTGRAAGAMEPLAYAAVPAAVRRQLLEAHA